MFAFSIKQALVSASRSPFSTLVSVISVALTFSLALIILWGYVSLQTLRSASGMNSAVTVLLSPDYSDKDVESIQEIADSHSFVEEARFVSSREALKSLRNSLPEAELFIESFEASPLPDSFEISVKPGAFDLPEFAEFIEALSAINGVYEVHPARAVQKAFSNLSAAAVGYARIALLLIALVVGGIIGSAVRVNMLSSRKKLLVTSLLGATPAQLRMPFVVEGVLISVAAGFLALLFYKLALSSLIQAFNPALVAVGFTTELEGLPAFYIALSLAALWFLSAFISLLSAGKIEEWG